jgi:kynurenine formamidase
MCDLDMDTILIVIAVQQSIRNQSSLHSRQASHRDPTQTRADRSSLIGELPPAYAIRPFAVIPIMEQVKANPNYVLQVADIVAWKAAHGRIPEGSVVFVCSDW